MNTRAATAISAVAIQPSVRQSGDTTNWPMIFWFEATSMSTHMTGTATTALMTAAQTSAVTALMDAMFPKAPRSVAPAMAP